MARGFDLQAIRNGLRSIFASIADISVARSEQDRAVDEELQPWIAPDRETDAELIFNLTSVRSVAGDDEIRVKYDAAIPMPLDTSGPGGTRVNGGFAVLSGGPRILTFTVKVECYDQTRTAFEYIEIVRSNLQRPSILARINALGCSLNEVRPSRDMSRTREGRLVSISLFELVLNVTSNLDDDVITTIETVHATGTVT